MDYYAPQMEAMGRAPGQDAEPASADGDGAGAKGTAADSTSKGSAPATDKDIDDMSEEELEELINSLDGPGGDAAREALGKQK